MKRFIVIYYAPQSFTKDMKNKSAEDMKKGQEEWMHWAMVIGDGLVDMGAPLGNGEVIEKSKTSKSTSEIVGYSVLQAENIGEAAKMLQEHPHLKWSSGCRIEVFEAMKM